MPQQKALMPYWSPIYLGIASLLISPVNSMQALAQANVLEEVLVVARKREESMQETPVAVSALSGTALEDAGLNDLTDLERVVPNLIANVGSGGGSAQLYVRGVGARNSGVNFDGGVAIYQDGVYLSRPDGSILESVDIQSVQVLRGPQGTLFGKNATGGALLYITNKPNENFEGKAEINVGNLDRLDGQLTVNVPLMEDTLYSRLSLYSTTRDGLTKDQYGRERGDIDRYGGQLQLRAMAGDNVVIDLNGHYSEVDQASVGQRCEPALGVPGAGWQGELQDDFIIIPSTGLSILEHCEKAAQLDENHVLSGVTDPVPDIYEAESSSLSATVDWNVNEELDLKSITAWRNVEAGQVADVYHIAIPLVVRTNYGWDIAEPRSTDWISQEFQLIGTAMDQSINYVIGLFASNEETDTGIEVGQSGPFFGSFGSPNIAYYTAQGVELFTDNTAYAAFSQVDWDINGAWNLTLGLRYTWEERKLERNTYTPDFSTTSTGAPPTNFTSNFWIYPDGPDSFTFDHGYAPGSRLEDKVTNSDWNPMASIQYLFGDAGPIDEGSAYFTIGTGFLSGGLSESLDINGNLTEYDPEEVVNYELGAKIDAFDNTLRVNTALFYIEYENRQLTSIGVNPETGTISARTINAKDSSITGFELETTWLPTDNLTLTFNYTFNDGDIKEFDDLTIVTSGTTDLKGCQTFDAGVGRLIDVCPVDRSHEDLPNLPRQVVYAAAQYNWNTTIGTVIARVDAAYSQDVNTCFDYASCLWKDGEGLAYDALSVGARLTWLSSDGSWRITAWGDNLSDYDYEPGGQPLVGTTQTRSIKRSIPRTYGMELAYTW